MAKAAVVAHFDSGNRLQNNFKTLLSCLVEVVDLVVLVTTSDLAASETDGLNRIITIRRPNIGYDFYSYRAGLAYLRKNFEADGVLLANSSFVVLQASLFTDSVRQVMELGDRYDVVGVTQSRQIAWHMQSYLLLLSENALRSERLQSFFDTIQPMNSKLEIIVSYEVGLSRLLQAEALTSVTLFRPALLPRFRAEMRWALVVARRDGWRGWLKFAPLRYRREVNYSHFCAEEIARRFGLVKIEVLRSNPHKLSTDFAERLAAPGAWAEVKNLLDDSRAHYQTGSGGLTALRFKGSPLADGRAAVYGKPRARGVQLAVVVHLFYADLLDEICRYLSAIVEPFDLYVTSPFEADVPWIINRTAGLAYSVTVWIVENRGRDVAPFLMLYRSGLLDGYRAVLKLHSKKSKYSTEGDEWRRQLFNRVIGDSLSIRKTMRLFTSRQVGVLGPKEFYLTNERFWGANQAKVRALLIATGQFAKDHQPQLGFFAGSMFWFSPAALELLKRIPEDQLCFEPENGMQDGTLAHAVERIFCTVARANGYRVTSLSSEALDISALDSSHNGVPVL